MVRSVLELVVEISSVVTLLPGDLVLTGTPAGLRTVPAGFQRCDITIEGSRHPVDPDRAPLSSAAHSPSSTTLIQESLA